jgi:hypothetical protein
MRLAVLHLYFDTFSTVTVLIYVVVFSYHDRENCQTGFSKILCDDYYEYCDDYYEHCVVLLPIS